jgi:hypothetical protein
LDYNRFALSGKCFMASASPKACRMTFLKSDTQFTKEYLIKLRPMRTRQKLGLWLFSTFGLVGLLVSGWLSLPAAAQSQADSSPTLTPTPSGRFITVTYIEPVNVRSGPSSFDYPVVGSIPVGDTAPAIGRSPAGEWVQIVFPAAPGGVGWVYAANVEVSPGPFLPVVELPPTATPAVTYTVNPTFAAAFQTAVPPTRLPTFTPPPPLEIPTYLDSSGSSSGRIQTGWLILGLGLIGVLGIAFSLSRRR